MWLSKDFRQMRNEVYPGSVIHPLLMGNEFLPNTLEAKKNMVSDLWFLKKCAMENNWKTGININKITKPFTAAILTDTFQNILWVSKYFHQMTGYLPQEAIGKTPKFLQGQNTSEEARIKIRASLSKLKPFQGELVNYKKDGSPYDCKVEIFPIFDSIGNHVNYIAFETDKHLNCFSLTA